MLEVKYEELKSEPKSSHQFETKHWIVELKFDESKKLQKKLEKLVDGRKDWVNPLYNYFLERISYFSFKDKKVHFDELKYEESVLAIITSWKEKVVFREESKQKTIQEVTEELGGFTKKPVKPLKKK